MPRRSLLPALLAALLPVLTARAAPAPDVAWQDYNIIMWQSHPPQAMRALRQIGVNAAMVYAKSGAINQQQLADALAANVPFYLENIATDIFAPYHMASGNTLFQAAKADYAADPTSAAAFERKPSLSDPAVFNVLRQRLSDVVRSMAPYRPLYYSLGDEMGIAETSSAWDFDISPPGLAAFRAWLREHYASLAALNAQWGSAFKSWDAVVPMLTDAALKCEDGNYSGWGDFKQWSDDSFAAAIRAGTDFIHQADPTAIAAMEGTQVPGWGGYDYTRLPHSVDLMEIYNAGHNIEIAHSIAPGLIVLTTNWDAHRNEQHRLWREILLGARGHVIWDGDGDFVRGDGTLGPRGMESAAFFPELRAGIPAQFIASQSVPAEVAILSSLPSFRALWLLDRKADTRPWTSRTMDDDFVETPWRQSLDSAADGLAHLGVPVRYLSPEMLGRGVPKGIRLLILPRSVALSDAGAKAVAGFVAHGGTVLADGTPGEFDGHLRHRTTPALAALAGKIVNGDFLQNAHELPSALAPVLTQAGIAPMLRLSTPEGAPVTDVTARLWRNGEVTLIGLQRDSNKDTAGEKIVLSLASPLHATDLRRHTDLGTASHFELAIDPISPTILAVSTKKLPVPVLTGPDHVALGGPAKFRLALQSASPAATPVVHVEWQSPSGAIDPRISRNLALHDGAASFAIPLAADDPAGSYILRMVDILTGTTTEHRVEVGAARKLAPSSK
jgi:hypothetical protein